MTQSFKAARRMQHVSTSKMSRLMGEAKRLQASGKTIVDLALGTPDYSAPDWLLSLAQKQIATGSNGYGDSRGSIALRGAIAHNFAECQGIDYDADTEVTVTSGASAALAAVVQALFNPRDRVIVFEPYYENFVPLLQFAGVVPQFVKLNPADWSINFDMLEKRVSKSTRGILINSPHNPTGRVFNRAELEKLALFCQRHNLIAISDEAYGPFTYGVPHRSIAAMPGMKERSIVVSSISKVLNVAGWRIGAILTSANLTETIRRANAISMGAPTPLQEACAEAFPYYEAFCQAQRRSHIILRDELADALKQAGIKFQNPEGTFSIFADLSSFGYADGDAAQASLLAKFGILAVSGDSFFSKKPSSAYLRFCFARSPETVSQAARLLKSSSV